MGMFSRKKKAEGAPTAKVSKSKKGGITQNALPPAPPPKPKWDDAWTRKTVEPEEIQELLRGCTLELKSKALDMPFLLLPFRPTSDPSAARTFIRNFFDGSHLHGELLAQELRLTAPMVLCSVAKWCWSRIAGGVVGWDAYELFKVGEQDSNMARDSFATFIPLSVESDARTKIIFDFFDLLSAIAAHGKTNGLGGRKLSRLAGWWAFEHSDLGNGFDGGYQEWAKAADATSHLFFAYLRSLAPESVRGINGISTLPISLQKLVQETEYPPEKPSLLQSETIKVAMIVTSVSPTPFALLRRTNHFQYRDEDYALQEFSEYQDPVEALTDECRRVLKAISSANQSMHVSTTKESTGLPDATWSRFEDLGFSGTFDDSEEDGRFGKRKPQGLRRQPNSAMNLGRPTTPSWADFLSSGFVDEANNGPPPLLLPPDKILPPINTNTRGHSSQSHQPRLESEANLEPGELASITRFDLDEVFWWVWISSLAGEEPSERKAAFGRCALVETIIRDGRWLVMEEIIKGAAPEPAEGAYIAEKKGFFSWTKRNKTMPRTKSAGKHDAKLPSDRLNLRHTQSAAVSKTSIGPDQHARIQAAAAQLQMRQHEQDMAQRRGRFDIDAASNKTSSVFTLQPIIMNEASPAMKWANKYDKDAIREAYLANNSTGRGLGQATMQTNGHLDVNPSLHRFPSSSSRGTERPVRLEEQEQKPEVPSKPASPELPKSPAARSEFVQPEQPIKKKQVAKAEPPSEPQFVERSESAMDGSIDYARSASIGPTGDENEKDVKQKKSGGGFMKLFGRKKSFAPKPSKMQEQGQLQQGGATIGRRFSGFRKNPTSSNGETHSRHVTSPSPVNEDQVLHMESPIVDRHSYERSMTSISRVDTADKHEADAEFARFDQGPLEDQPAFVGDSESESPRVSEEIPVDYERPPTVPEEGNPQGENPADAAMPVQDRWAQIRKNAAERAAQRQSEEQSRGGTTMTDGDGETSGEETIESRVARIKARVAELTGNMDTGSPLPSVVAARRQKFENL